MSISQSASGLDVVRDADVPWLVPGACRGPMAVRSFTRFNQMGSRGLTALLLRPDGAVI
jgi:hypothetical protein